MRERLKRLSKQEFYQCVPSLNIAFILSDSFKFAKFSSRQQLSTISVCRSNHRHPLRRVLFFFAEKVALKGELWLRFSLVFWSRCEQQLSSTGRHPLPVLISAHLSQFALFADKRSSNTRSPLKASFALHRSLYQLASSILRPFLGDHCSFWIFFRTQKIPKRDSWN